MASRSPFWSSVRDLFGGSSSRRRRSRGKRPSQSFLAQFDGRDGAVGRQAPAPFGGFDTLEVRVMLAVTPTAESDFGFDTATGTITSYSGAGGDIAIPATIGGVTVTGIGNNAFKDNATLTSLSLPTGLTTIGNRAFFGCTGLTSLSLPTNLTTIDDFAFYRCTGLTSLSLPTNLTTIRSNVFAYCTGLTSLTIPDGVTRIGFNSFAGCIGLTSLTIPNSVTTIDNRAFENCYSLTSLYFLGNAPTVGSYAFDGVSATIYYLTGTTGWSSPFKGLTAVGVAAVDYRSGDFAYSISKDGATITEYTGSGGAVTIPDTIFGLPVTGIGVDAFYNKATLTSLVIPATVTTIGDGALSGCTGLTSLYFLGNAPTTVGSDAFSGVTATIYYLTGTTGWSSPFSGLTAIAINAAPTAVSLSPASASVAENTSTAVRLKMADVAITDDGAGTNATTLSGVDAVSFEVDAGVLYLKAGTLLDFETKTSYSVTVNVADSSVAGSTPVTAEFTLTVTNVNEAPTAVSLSPTSASVAENTATAVRLKMADIVVTDDALGTNATTLSGVDAASFEVDAGVLYLKAGTVLDFETKTSYSVTVNVADSSVAGSTPVTATFTLTVTNVNEAPTAVSLSPTSASVAENTSTAVRLKMADVAIIDDGVGTNATTLSGVDAASFEVDAGVLYLKAGTVLDFETKTSYALTVNVTDSSVAGSTPVTATFTLTVTDVVEDFTKPVLVGVAAPAAGTYPSSAKLLFTATFSEPVTVTGPAGISFTGISGGSAGKAARIATYESGSGTSQIVFSYLIAAGEAAKKGLVVAGAIQLPAGASVADLAGNTPAALTFTAPAAGSVKVDGSVPVLTKTTGPAAKKFKAGEVLSFSVTWNEKVFVVGAPRILIAVGGSPREAVYASGSGSKTVKFNYVAAAGDNGGVSLGSGAIALSSGTIRDSIGNPAGLVLKAVNLSKVAIDTARPAVISVALPSAGSYAKGKTATIGVTFGETLKVTSKPTLVVTLAPGVTRTFVFSKATGGTAVFTYKFAAAETVTGFTLPGAISLAGTAAIRDAVGNAAILSLPAPA